jgi:hypothetical protein
MRTTEKSSDYCRFDCSRLVGIRLPVGMPRDIHYIVSSRGVKRHPGHSTIQRLFPSGVNVQLSGRQALPII